jgi:hypothetical protein
MAYQLKRSLETTTLSNFLNKSKILNVSAKHFENGVWKSKYCLGGAYVSIKEAG